MDPWTFALYMLGTGVSGVIGNHADRLSCRAMDMIVERLRQGGPPANGDLQRAVRKAYLQATLVMFDARLRQLGVEQGFLRVAIQRVVQGTVLRRKRRQVKLGDREEAAWLENVRRVLRDEQHDLPHTDDLPLPTEAERQIGLLLQPQGLRAKERIGEFRAVLERGLLDELRRRFGEGDRFPPASIKHMVKQGWDASTSAEGAGQLTWFDLLCAFFVHELKTNERVRGIFEGRLLAQLTVEGVAVTPEAVEAQFAQAGGEILQRLEHVEEQLLQQGARSAIAQERLDEMLRLAALLPAIEQQQRGLEAVVRDEAERTRRMLETFMQSQQQTAEDRRQLEEEMEWLRARQATPQPRHERVAGPVPGAIVDHFKDRVRELRALRERLADAHIRLIAVCGRGGMGKTALVTKLLRELQGDFTLRRDDTGYDVDGIVYVALRQSESRSPDKIVELIGRTLDADAAAELRAAWREQAPLPDKLEFLFRRTLGTRHCLIVLDNFEDVLDGDDRIRTELADLRQFVEACLDYDHDARVLITSRRGLVLAPDLEGRAGARRADVPLDDGLPEPDAIALLRELDADGRLGLADVPDATLREVVQRCHGIPRTLETLVGTLRQRRTLTLARLVETDDEGTLARICNDPARELYDSLSPQERLVMQALAVYDRTVSTVAVRYLLPGLDVDGLLDALARNYAVTYDRDRFSLHPLDQQYAYRQIPDGDTAYALPALHTRAAAFFHEIGKPQAEWKAIGDLESHLQEFRHLVRAGLYDRACALLNAIDFDYLSLWGHSALIVALRSQLTGRLTDRELQEVNWGHLGLALNSLGEARRAITCLEQALDIARERESKLGMGAWLGNLGLAYRALGETRKAIGYHEQALTISREIGDRQGEGADLGNLGLAYADLGETRKAIGYHEQALTISREIGDRQGEGNHLGNLGSAYAASGKTRKAIEHYEQALTISREIGDRQGEGNHLGNLGNAYADLGETRKAIEYHEQALAIAREVGARQVEGIVLGNLGNAYDALGETDKAIGYYEQALAISREIGDRRGEGADLGNLGLAYYALGETRKAIEYYEQALAISREIGDRRGEGNRLGNLGNAYYALGETDKAREYHEQASTISREIGSP